MKHDLKNAFGTAPDSFRMQVNEMMDQLEDADMKKRYKISTMLLAAALAAVMLAGAGLAAEMLGLFSFFGSPEYPITPLDGAAEMVETNLGSAENELAEYAVQEAVYDGRSVMLQLKIVPKDAENHALYNMGFYDSVEALYAHRGDSIDAALGGKEPLFYAASVQAGEQEGGAESWHSELQPDGSLILWYSHSFAEAQGDAIEICAGMRTSAGGADVAMEAIRFTLERSDVERAVRLEPVNAADTEFSILDAGIVFTKLRGYVEIDYRCQPDRDSASGFAMQLTDAEGNAIAMSGNIIFSRTLASDGSTVQHASCEIQSLEVLSETVWIELWDIEKNCSAGRVECRVVEA